jgi:hypothetical protein
VAELSCLAVYDTDDWSVSLDLGLKTNLEMNVGLRVVRSMRFVLKKPGCESGAQMVVFVCFGQSARSKDVEPTIRLGLKESTKTGKRWHDR